MGQGLIVTADDFGLSIEVNEAVEQAHREGVLSAASLMVAGAAAADAVARARRLPGLRIGLHLALTDAAPALPPAELAALTGPDGRFRTDMAGLGTRMVFDPAARRQLAREIEAQVKAYRATGLPLDHLNAHKHFHLHPTIARLAIAAARPLGLRAIRVPFEPAAQIAALEPPGPGFGPRALGLGAWFLRRRARRAGLWSPDRVFGLAWSGAMTPARLLRLLECLPGGVTEIYTHPAVADVFAGSAPGYRYREELAALTDPAVRVRAAMVRLGGYSDFAAG